MSHAVVCCSACTTCHTFCPVAPASATTAAAEPQHAAAKSSKKGNQASPPETAPEAATGTGKQGKKKATNTGAGSAHRAGGRTVPIQNMTLYCSYCVQHVVLPIRAVYCIALTAAVLEGLCNVFMSTCPVAGTSSGARRLSVLCTSQASTLCSLGLCHRSLFTLHQQLTSSVMVSLHLCHLFRSVPHIVPQRVLRPPLRFFWDGRFVTQSYVTLAQPLVTLAVLPHLPPQARQQRQNPSMLLPSPRRRSSQPPRPTQPLNLLLAPASRARRRPPTQVRDLHIVLQAVIQNMTLYCSYCVQHVVFRICAMCCVCTHVQLYCTTVSSMHITWIHERCALQCTLSALQRTCSSTAFLQNTIRHYRYSSCLQVMS
jgi:hypothetical protein